MNTEGGGEFDLHGHSRYSKIPEGVPHYPVDVIERAKEVGLDGVAITGHDTVKGLDEALNLAAKHGVIVVPGLEISSFTFYWKGFHFPHILALGVTPDLVKARKDRIPTFRDPETVIKWIHDHGGIAIAPHPNPKGAITALSYEQVERYQHLLDGIETHRLTGKNEKMEQLARRLNIAGLGSSDFHKLEQVGLVRTRVLGNCERWEDVTQAIKQNNVEAFIQDEVPAKLQHRSVADLILRGYFR